MTVISIEVYSARHFPQGHFRRVPEAEITAVASACAKLLDELGQLGKHVEVLKVVPWHGKTDGPDIFDIKAVLSMNRNDPAKAEAKYTFEDLSQAQKSWDSNLLSARIVSVMKREICAAAKRQALSLERASHQWVRLLPESEKA